MKNEIKVQLEGKTITSFPYSNADGNFLDCLLQNLPETYRKGSFCRKKGICGNCRIRFLTGVSEPSAPDRKLFSPKELREGIRLACTAKPSRDCVIEVHFIKEYKMTLVSDTLLTKEVYVKNANMQEGYFCAVDLGTTTVVMQLIERKSGKVVATKGFENPQRYLGADVISRVESACLGKQKELQEKIVKALEDGLCFLSKKGKPEFVVIAGNTTMGHLLLGYPANGLGYAPFLPYHIGESYFNLGGCQAVFLPGVSAFIGADIVAGIYACNIREQEGYSLFVDLGTNGEIVLGNEKQLFCTATAAGPAFEGTGGVVGSDMTALAAGLLESGRMDATGCLAEPWFETGCQINDKTRVCQKDVRNLQMAKAAVYTGIKFLLKHAGIMEEKIERFYLAGGFGYFLDVEKAEQIGLFPGYLWNRAKAVGNTSLAGAVKYGMNTERDEHGAVVFKDAEKLTQIITACQSLNLAKEPEFQENYINAMEFRRM